MNYIAVTYCKAMIRDEEKNPFLINNCKPQDFYFGLLYGLYYRFKKFTEYELEVFRKVFKTGWFA